MVKNIIIGLLVVVSLGVFIFALYNQKIAEKAIIEVETCTLLAKEQQEHARRSEQLAYEALADAKMQLQRAQEELEKCK